MALFERKRFVWNEPWFFQQRIRTATSWLVFALVLLAIAVIVGVSAALVVVHGRGAVARIFDLGLTLPLGTSAVTIGFGILVALGEPPLEPPALASIWRNSTRLPAPAPAVPASPGSAQAALARTASTAAAAVAAAAAAGAVEAGALRACTSRSL